MKILLADDHGLFLEGLQNLLRAGGYDVVGVAYDGLEALQLARSLHPDLILMDVRMPNCNGLDATRLIKAEFPDIRIVMLSTSAENSDLFEALKSGANGYLLKNLKPSVLFNYLAGLERGEAPLSRELSSTLLQEFTQQASILAAQERMLGKKPEQEEEAEEDKKSENSCDEKLTTRQLDILEMVAAGLSYKEVGVALHISENTVKYHMGAIIHSLRLRNREQVVAYALSTGLVHRSKVEGVRQDWIDPIPFQP